MTRPVTGCMTRSPRTSLAVRTGNEVETCALAHLDAGPGYDDLAAAVEADPGDGAAADALAAYRMATRIADGRPVTATVGG